MDEERLLSPTGNFLIVGRRGIRGDVPRKVTLPIPCREANAAARQWLRMGEKKQCVSMIHIHQEYEGVISYCNGGDGGVVCIGLLFFVAREANLVFSASRVGNIKHLP